jgi:predicted negative regulator of RcsB-dependent stress response
MARRNPWIWISALLLLVSIGLLIWALSLRSDLDDTQQQVADLQAQIEGGSSKAEDIAAAAKSLADDVRGAVGNAGADLDAAKERIEAQAADAQATAGIATDCAKAYGAALSALAGTDDVGAQLSALRADLESISAECRAALEGG